MRFSKTKIVCTIGPATAGRDEIEKLIRAGMDVARLNFSHGEHSSHIGIFNAIRECSRRLGHPVAILQDLQGIKIRTGPIEAGELMLRRGDTIIVRPGTERSDGNAIFISYPHIVRDAKAGNRILIDDGLLKLIVTGKDKGELRARVAEGGLLRDRKGVNLPDMKVRAHALTDKDKLDLKLGIKLGVDYVAVSFVRCADDVLRVRAALNKARADIPLIAKIEKPEAIEHIDEIIGVVDALMVARGDLGVEMSPEQVPVIQKMLIARANQAGVPVITATQMLESMTEHSTPTRAEANDVANAVLDGSDAVMLSAETSRGRYPVQAVKMMERIIRVTEEQGTPKASCINSGETFSETVAFAATAAARDIRARYIVAFTQTGYTARLLSKARPGVPIIAFTTSEAVQRRMALYWGVMPLLVKPIRDMDGMFREVERTLIKARLAHKGDRLVITASAPIGGAGKTNFMKLHLIG